MVQGSVTEQRTRGGKDVGGEYLWMDLMEKRNGTWVVVCSAGAKCEMTIAFHDFRRMVSNSSCASACRNAGRDISRSVGA